MTKAAKQFPLITENHTPYVNFLNPVFVHYRNAIIGGGGVTQWSCSLFLLRSILLILKIFIMVFSHILYKYFLFLCCTSPLLCPHIQCGIAHMPMHIHDCQTHQRG